MFHDVTGAKNPMTTLTMFVVCQVLLSDAFRLSKALQRQYKIGAQTKESERKSVSRPESVTDTKPSRKPGGLHAETRAETQRYKHNIVGESEIKRGPNDSM